MLKPRYRSATTRRASNCRSTRARWADVIDIRKLYGQTGKFTYDPGFMSTAACNSAITYIDGDKGELLYRGYPIDNLAQNADFLESCYLLLKGELPNAAQKKEFVDTVTKHTMVHEQMHFFFRGFRRDAHPMAIPSLQSVRCRRSTTTRSTSTIRVTVKCRRSA